jgi:hypothetical protein
MAISKNGRRSCHWQKAAYGVLFDTVKLEISQLHAVMACGYMENCFAIGS